MKQTISVLAQHEIPTSSLVLCWLSSFLSF